MHSASSHTTPTHAAPRVPFLQRRITNPTSDQTPVEGWALHTHPHQPPTYRVRLPLSGLPSGQTQFRGLPLLLLEQSAAVHTHPPVVSARVRLPVQLLARQPRLQILTHHLIRRYPFRPPAYVHRSPPQLAITACACPRHTCSAAHNQGPRGVVPSTEEQGRDRTNHSPSNSLSSMPSSNMPTAATSSSSCCVACNAATPHTAIGSTKPPTRLVQHSARRRWSART